MKNVIEIQGVVYDLCYEVTQSDNGELSLSVKKCYNGKILDVSRVNIMPMTFDVVVEIAGLMCRNTVTPSGFCDVIRDLVYDKIIVE